MTRAVDLANSVAGGVSLGFKNRIINGAMQIWQRGTSFTNTANTYQYTSDRWLVFGGVGLPATSSQISTGLQNFPFALRVQRPNGSTATTNTVASQVIETVNCRDLASTTVTISFFARAGSNYSPTGNALGVWLATGTGTDQGAQNMINYAWTNQAYTQSSVTLTPSFQQFSVSLPVPAGTNEVGILFVTYPTGTAGANDWFEVTGVQLEVGSTATNFEYRDYGRELMMCQRYYWKTFVVDTAPAQNVAPGNQLFNICTNNVSNGLYFPVSMRATPTITTFNPYAANSSFRVPNSTTDISVTPAELSASGIGFFVMTRTAPSALHGQITASAEL